MWYKYNRGMELSRERNSLTSSRLVMEHRNAAHWNIATQLNYMTG